MPAVYLLVITSSLAFEQMVTLQLLNQHKREKGESSNEEEDEDEEEQEEERPRGPSQEQSVSASSGPCQVPLSRDRQESPMVPSEQVVREAEPLPPGALRTPQEDAQRREGEPTEAEALSEIRDDSLPPELACIPSQRALGPPTSIPPLPPSPVTVDSEREEAFAASPLGNACVEGQESSTRLSLTSDSKKGDPLPLEPESSGGEPQPAESQKEEDATSSTGPSKELSSTEAGSASAGAALGPNHSSQCSRYIPLSRVSGTRWLQDWFFQGWQLILQRLNDGLTHLLIHAFIHVFIQQYLP